MDTIYFMQVQVYNKLRKLHMEFEHLLLRMECEYMKQSSPHYDSFFQQFATKYINSDQKLKYLQSELKWMENHVVLNILNIPTADRDIHRRVKQLLIDMASYQMLEEIHLRAASKYFELN